MNYNYNVLNEMYARLEKNPNDQLKGLTMYHSSVGYAVAAVQALFGTEYTYEEMVTLMVEEKLLNKTGLPVKRRDLVSEPRAMGSSI